MIVYTVQRMDKFDYDFSVEITNKGCFTDKEKALHKAKRVYKNMCAEYADEMEKYSDEYTYPDEDEGALRVEEDPEGVYYQISYGLHEDYTVHSVWVDEWNTEE